MRQIIPFQKELLFKTKVSDITSISLEHDVSSVNNDSIHGEFHVTGDYKMTEGSINRESFSFDIPFEIDLDDDYDMDSIVIDIDNFYYEIVNNESLKVNIDVFVEGEKKEIIEDSSIVIDEGNKDANNRDIEEGIVEEPPEVVIDRDDEIEESVQYKKNDNVILDDEFNIFDSMDHSDTYVTYHVYVVKEGDSIDSIMQKYGVEKEDISLYNDLENIKPGTKLIIPNSHE